MADYQKISEDLVAKAENYHQALGLDVDSILDSVRRLCESPEGGLSFVDATSNICDNTRNKLIAILKWVCGSATSGANAMNWLLELVKLFILTIIGFIVAMVLGKLQGRLNFEFFYWVLGIMIIVTIVLLVFQWFLFTKKNAELDMSIGSSSLIEIAKSET